MLSSKQSVLLITKLPNGTLARIIRTEAEDEDGLKSFSYILQAKSIINWYDISINNTIEEAFEELSDIQTQLANPSFNKNDYSS